MSSPTTPAIELRPMGVGDILDSAFRLYKAQFVPFLVIALVAFLPYALFTLIVGLASSPAQPPQNVSSFETAQNPFAASAGVNSGGLALAVLGPVILLIIVFPLVQSALTYNISGAILGERLSAGESYRRAAGRVLPLLWTQLLVGVVVFIGFLLLVVPGIIFSFWFMIIAPLVVLERISGFKALRRSRELMRGNVNKGVSISLTVFVLSFAIEYGCGAVLALAPWKHAVFVEVGNTIVQAMILPLQTAPMILFYYDLRIRKEAFDLQRLAESVEEPATPVSVGS
jgi:hypothetical protein